MVRNRQLAQLAAVLGLAAIAVVVAIVISSGGGNDDETPATAPSPGASAPDARQELQQELQDLYGGIPQNGIHLGKAAPATLVEIADLQCPFCAQYSTQALPTIVRDYVRTGKVRYELHFRSFLGRDSVRAAGAAAYAASENRMYEFADVFYRNQGHENSDYADAAFIRTIASAVPGLDPDKAAAAADDPLAQPLVKAGEQFARDLGSTSTPDFYVRQGGRLQPLNPQGTDPQDYAAALDALLGSS